MADLKTLNYSLTGVEEDKDKKAKDLMMADIVVDANPIQESEWVIYKLHKKNGRGKVHIDGRDDVINPETKTTERIWLLNGVTSIWESKIGERLKDKDFVTQHIRSLTFDQHGVCRIPSWDTNAIAFAENCRHNIENKNRRGGSKMEFYKYDATKQEKELLKKEMAELEMVMAVRDMEVDKMKKHASFVGISFLDDLGQPKTDDGIRRELMVRAKRSPEGFQAIINTKEIEIAYIVKQAILQTKIDIGSKPGVILWGKGGGMICRLPAGRKPLEYLIEMAMDSTSKEGKQFLEQLNSLN